MKNEFISKIIAKGYKKPSCYINELQKVFIILDEESKEKIKNILKLFIKPDICFFNTCVIKAGKPGVNMLIKKINQSYYKLYQLDSLGRLKCIQLPENKRNNNNAYIRKCNQDYYLIRMHGEDGYDCIYAQSEIPIIY